MAKFMTPKTRPVVLLAALLAATNLPFIAPQYPSYGETNSNRFPPVLTVEGATIYKAGGNSVPDARGAAENAERLKPVTSFMDYLASVLDGNASDQDVAAAYNNVRSWAAAGALLGTPDTPGRVARVWIATGFGLLLVKFKARGVQLTNDVLGWYTQLASAVFNDYAEPLQKAGYKGLYSNVYPWVGASEAIAGLLTNDERALHNQAVSWTRMLEEVQPDGTLKGELMRGQRSLEYHLRTIDGLLILRTVRRAIGQHDHPQPGAQLRNLLDMVGHSLCDPSYMARLAGTEQEPPSSMVLAFAYAFGGDILPDSWMKCKPEIKNGLRGQYGGDPELSVKALSLFRPRAIQNGQQ